MNRFIGAAIVSSAVAGACGGVYLYSIYHKYQVFKLQNKLKQEDERLRQLNKFIFRFSIGTACFIISLPVLFRLRKVLLEFYDKMRDIWA